MAANYKKVKVSANLINFPRACCCCGREGADKTFKALSKRTTGKRVIKTNTRTWNFPICESCDRWIQSVGLVKGMAWVVCLLLLFTFAPSLLIVLPLALFLIYKQTSKKPGCRSKPVVYTGWQGTVHTFLIANQSFYELFTAANNKKLVG
jgi:hypothetical protein